MLAGAITWRSTQPTYCTFTAGVEQPCDAELVIQNGCRWFVVANRKVSFSCGFPCPPSTAAIEGSLDSLLEGKRRSSSVIRPRSFYAASATLCRLDMFSPKSSFARSMQAIEKTNTRSTGCSSNRNTSSGLWSLGALSFVTIAMP